MSHTPRKPRQQKPGMRRILATVLCILIALALLLPLLSTALLNVHAVTTTDLKNQISDLKNSASSAASKKKEIEAKLAAIRSDKAKAMDRKNLLAQQLAAIDTEIVNTNNQIIAYTALIGEQEAALTEAQGKLDYAYTRFYQRARSMEEGGSFSYLSVLFLANSWSDLLDRLALVDEIMVYDNTVVDELTAAKEQVELVLADLRETQAGLEEQRALQDAQRAEQAAKVSEAEAVLRELKQDEAQAQALHEAAEAEKRQLEAQIAKKEKEYKAMVAAANFTTGSGYAYPLPSSYTRISSGFKWRNCPFHGREHHNGIDLPAPTGVKVSAVQGGVVIVSTYAPSSYGNYIVIDHGNGRTTLYGHLSSRSVKEGNVVKQGQTIGLVGSTGSSTAPHLHLELKVNGSRRDPKTMFPGVKFTGDLESN